MTKEEVERLLRHGAYDIFNEEKAGSAEAESKDFIEQDIDSILQRRSRTVIHDNTGSGSNAAGGTFSKASFVAPQTPDTNQQKQQEDVDIEDPDFWKKMLGEAQTEVEAVLKPRRRNKANYSEKSYNEKLQQAIASSSDASGDSESDATDESDDDESDESDATDAERARWGGHKALHWKKSQAIKVLEAIERYGYGIVPWEEFRTALLPDCSKFTDIEVSNISAFVSLL